MVRDDFFGETVNCSRRFQTVSFHAPPEQEDSLPCQVRISISRNDFDASFFPWSDRCRTRRRRVETDLILPSRGLFRPSFWGSRFHFSVFFPAPWSRQPAPSDRLRAEYKRPWKRKKANGVKAGLSNGEPSQTSKPSPEETEKDVKTCSLLLRDLLQRLSGTLRDEMIW